MSKRKIKSKINVHCHRCNRRMRESDRLDWNMMLADGIPVAHVCPGCQTADETAEGMVREAMEPNLLTDLRDSGTAGGWQLGNDEVWWDSPVGMLPAYPWPVYRHGGASDGLHIGTMLSPGKVNIGYDADGNLLPGFSHGTAVER